MSKCGQLPEPQDSHSSCTYQAIFAVKYYSRETDDKITTFELCFMRCGNFLGGSGNVIWEWEGNGNEIQQSQEWEWELLDGNGRERESKTHSQTPLLFPSPLPSPPLLFPSTIPPSLSPLPPLHFIPFPPILLLQAHPLNPARRYGEHSNLPDRSGRSPAVFQLKFYFS